MIYKIPVRWESWGVIEVEAPTLEEAIEIFDSNVDTYNLPSESEYIDGSFERDEEEYIEWYNLPSKTT
jgi:hypothetical protein